MKFSRESGAGRTFPGPLVVFRRGRETTAAAAVAQLPFRRRKIAPYTDTDTVNSAPVSVIREKYVVRRLRVRPRRVGEDPRVAKSNDFGDDNRVSVDVNGENA